MKSSAFLGILVAGLFWGTTALADPPSGEQPPASPAAVRQWIGGLDSDDFSVREEASRKLVQAGAAAIDAVAAAAQGDDLEVTARSVGVLRALLEAEDLKTQDAAADALSHIAAGHVTLAAEQAAIVLHSYQQKREERAIAEIRRLGGAVVFGNPFTGETEATQVILGSEWQGGKAGFALLKRVADLEQLSVHGQPVTDDDLISLEGLDRLSQVNLFGTKVTEAGARHLMQSRPGIRVDRRGNAMLGVAGQPGTNGCQITLVQAGSAAEQAGLQVDDVIVRFQGVAIADFEALTVQIGTRHAGEKVTVEIQRGDELLKKEVTLGEWK